MIALLCFAHIFHAASQPLFEYNLSNPAFCAFNGTYEAHITANQNFIFDYMSAGARIDRAGITFANYRINNYRQSWVGVGYRLPIPAVIGTNLGTAQIDRDSYLLTDFGLWFDHKLLGGISIRNLLNDERVIRGGVTYQRNWLNLMAEIENGGPNQRTYLNVGAGYRRSFRGFEIGAFGGCNLHHLAFTLSLAYKHFKAGFLISDSLRFSMLVSIFLEPPVREKIVVFQETLEVFVEKPIDIKRPAPKKKPAPPGQLTSADRLRCEQHYLKGIEYYINNRLDEAIDEWSIVVGISPDYKDVRRYLENARAKKEILKQE